MSSVLRWIRSLFIPEPGPVIRDHEEYLRETGFRSPQFVFRYRDNGWYFGDDEHQPFGPYPTRREAIADSQRRYEAIQQRLGGEPRWRPSAVKIYLK